ncbi:MAG: PepSY domain-containing protein, partial [Magnetococcales bacterium]|nr:PepSY domain-containing protein [Magnetococcales bacterium]
MLILLIMVPVVGRADDGDHLRARRLHQQGAIRPLKEIVALARKLRPGELLEAELHESRGRVIYEIELLDEDGRIWEFHFDASSGESLGSHLEEEEEEGEGRREGPAGR